MACSWLTRELGNFSREFFEYITPAMDIFEDENELVVKIDLPGYAKKDINLSIEEDILRIRAKKEPDEGTSIGSIYYKQRPRQIDKSSYYQFLRKMVQKWLERQRMSMA
jgi:HSP20 family protein